MRKIKIKTATAKKYRKKRDDPVGNIVRRHLKDMIINSGKSEEEIIESLKEYGKSYSDSASFNIMVFRSTLNLRSFIRLMLALGINSYNFTVTEEEKEETIAYEALNNND